MNRKQFAAWLLLLLMLLSLLSGCAGAQGGEDANSSWMPERSMELQFATQFQVDYYSGGYKLITLGDGSRFLTVPEGCQVPEAAPKDAVPLYQPLENIYLAATSAMCLFDALNRLDAISLSGSRAESWYIDNARKSMDD